jgi:hypothetical protein
LFHNKFHRGGLRAVVVWCRSIDGEGIWAFPLCSVCPECVLFPDRNHVRTIQLQKYKMFGNQQRKFRKNLEGTGKMLIFAASE